jgi:hypothetical protein
MARLILSLGLIAVIGLGLGYVGSAWWRTAETLHALRTGNAAVLEQRVDFEKLRADLQPQLETQVEAIIAQRADRALADAEGPLGSLVRALGIDRAAVAVAARAAIPQALGEISTPEGLARLAKQQFATQADQPVPSFPEFLGASVMVVQARTLDAVEVRLADPRTQDATPPIVLEMARTGPFDWKVQGARLPDNFVARMIDGTP